MAKTTLATFGFGYNLERIKYPWIASIESALALSESVFFCACDSDTLEKAKQWETRESRLHVIYHSWADEFFGPEDQHRYRIQAVVANLLLDAIGTHYDYALKLDMDEVLCEWTFEKFRQELDWMNENFILLGKPRYRHFCPDDKTTFKFIYDAKSVISRTDVGFRFNLDPLKGNADACALGGAPEFQTSLEVHHLGKMHMGRREAALFKEHDFQRHYHYHNFPDPKVEMQMESGELDYLKVFDIALNRGEFKPYNGPHPKFVQGWLEEMRRREQDYRATH